ncbi:rho GTPase-activating protein 19-like isoform X2 [Gigantopelta aegis]|nr:rho GTPase-activating protein 19-like isoform X2 [Gigantopelta aegis]
MSSSTVRRRQTEAEKNVNRLRSVMPEKLAAMCKMHLSFLLDLSGSKLDELQDGETKHEKKRGCSTSSSKKKDKNLFGDSLSEEHVAQIYQLIEFLGRSENIRTEGLFRKSGNVCRQRHLKELLNQNVSNLGLEDGTFSPHDCAATLKHYLSELPEPLLTERHTEAHKQVLEMASDSLNTSGKSRVRDKQLKALQLLMLMLPRENALLLECLLDLLHHVSMVPENMMTADALGTIFAPSLLCSKKLSPTEFHIESCHSTKIVSFLIENNQQVFKIPRELAVDIANFWTKMETPENNSEKTDMQKINNHFKAKKYVASADGPPISTVVNYTVNRHTPTKEQTVSDTQVALAELYAHVQAMPDSSKKKKLLKQFNRANGMPMKNKHVRSKTFGESLKKHFPVLHKHRRRGSNDPSQVTEGLNWALTKPMIIDETCNDQVTIIDCGKFHTTPHRQQNSEQCRYRTQPPSPVVHIVDMSQSDHNTPSSQSPRKRRSSEDIENARPPKDKRSTKQPLPSSENEINYISVTFNAKKTLKYTPDRVKPVAMVSPITQSMLNAPQDLQKAVMTPRSRKPMFLGNESVV